jgi:hypothetical protein
VIIFDILIEFSVSEYSLKLALIEQATKNNYFTQKQLKIHLHIMWTLIKNCPFLQKSML